MKKLLLCTAALTMFAGIGLETGSNNVHADGQDVGQEAGSGAKTNTLLEIDNSNNNTKPVNPDNTENELDNPQDNNVNNTKSRGELTLDAVPSLLNFGKMSDASETKGGYNTENITNGNMVNGNKQYYYAQVTDHRAGAKGWKLTASMDNMNNMNNSDVNLNGASITLNSSGKASPAYNNNNTAPNTNTNVNLDPYKGPVNVINAEQGTGENTWFDLFNSIQLKYGQSSTGTYKGQITWNLIDAPDSTQNQ
ncbi:WxL domain-containing protein [Apilactobacillus timberlakei]|uniref:WxL domain-containing protein n=1 Tax=Apilactobacillus timberlakei TaxID=2008380 RepID=A0ABY2YVR7_9LACO|nr:WxL domain-containing protein [Apilactobacillus timberlakei]TPR12332.1 WxL domain-containing protein [Apilactobacillus timberlakei]TPR12840.1 WxL domain-containing protein [Apilactobacillus timberlakei]TPR14390.1 WxL domain-containing protein [Apilactobacillus timberlakei]